jgi:hypothetical protein
LDKLLKLKAAIGNLRFFLCNFESVSFTSKLHKNIFVPPSDFLCNLCPFWLERYLSPPPVTNSWERFRLKILKLPLEQQVALYNWLAATIVHPQTEATEFSEIPLGAGRAIVESKQVGKVTYRLELVKCGKLTCRCATGQLHGPYWYAYQRQVGRVKSWYVGKQLPSPGD